MTHLSNGTVATDLDAYDDKAALTAQATSSTISKPGLSTIT